MLEFTSSFLVPEQISTLTHSLAFMGLGPMEMMLVGVAAVLLFGRNLPSVARSAGKSLSEFKKGMQDLQNEVKFSIDTDSNVVASNRSAPVMPDSADSLDEEKSDSDYDSDYSERRETSSPSDSSEVTESDTMPTDTVPADTVNDEDDELLNQGYPLPRNANSGMSDDSLL